MTNDISEDIILRRNNIFRILYLLILISIFQVVFDLRNIVSSNPTQFSIYDQHSNLYILIWEIPVNSKKLIIETFSHTSICPDVADPYKKKKNFVKGPFNANLYAIQICRSWFLSEKACIHYMTTKILQSYYVMVLLSSIQTMVFLQQLKMQSTDPFEF